MNVAENILLAKETTFGVGGSGRFFVTGEKLSDVREACVFANSKQLPFLVLGGGSNVLFDDGMAEAVIFKPKLLGIDMRKGERVSLLVAAASERWDDVVSFAVENGLHGFENLSGIPGTVGGALVQNIGAYGAALSKYVRSVEAFDMHTNENRIFTTLQCQFAYRNSIFKKTGGRFVITGATFELSSAGLLDTSYRDLRDVFKERRPQLDELREAILSIRAKKFPDLQKEGTAGSFFKNPIVSKDEAEQLKKRFPDVPLYIIPEEEGVKVPLAWFLDHVLQLRGFTLGPVRAFEQQPLVLVAKRGATARDVRRLARHIQEKVRDEIGLSILPEVCVLDKNAFTQQLTF